MLNQATWNYKRGDTIDLTEERLERIAEYSSEGRDSFKVWKVLLEYQPESFLAHVAWAKEIITMPYPVPQIPEREADEDSGCLANLSDHIL